MKLFFLAICLVPLIQSAPTPLDVQKLTDEYIFNTPMLDFLKARNKGSKLEGLEWTADGCSSSPDHPLGFDFHDSCLRHDFGYRNYKLQGRCKKAMKKRIDKNFQKDMYNECVKEEDEERRNKCENVADGYYIAVHVFGRKHFCH